MKIKSLNLLLVITSLLGYLEWSGSSHSFLFQAEAAVFSKIFVDPKSVIHPFTILPLLGQLMLLFTLFQKEPSKIITYIGISGLSLLLIFIAVIGMLSLHMKILLSTIPFMVVAFMVMRQFRILEKNNRISNQQG